MRQGKPQLCSSPKHVDAVAHTRALHQQCGALTAEGRAGDKADTFGFSGQNDVGDPRVVLAKRN